MIKEIDFNNLSNSDMEIISQRLLAPFHPKHYTFKPGASAGKDKKVPLIAIDPRLVATRLNRVFGVGNWSTNHIASLDHAGPAERKTRDGAVEDLRFISHVSCSISIHRGDYKVTQSNIGDNTDWFSMGNPFTNPWAQAFKRAAVNLGIGAFLYECKLPALAYDYTKGFGLTDAQIKEILEKNDIIVKALESVGFTFTCEQTGAKVSWLEAAQTVEKYGGVLSVAYVKEQLAK